MAKDLIVNLSDPREKRVLLEVIRALEGNHRVQWCKHRPRRTDRQNRYYWPCFVQPFGDYLREQGNDFSDEMAHEVFKHMFLSRTVTDKKTGQELSYPASTTVLNTAEFNEYLDRCAQFLAEKCDIVVPEPSMFHELVPAHPGREKV